MAHRNSNNNTHPRTVGVDITSHKQERNVADTRTRTKLRVRYYVELVVGSPRERHLRLGFSGDFKTLMALHETFLRAYLDKYGSEQQHQHASALANSASTTTRASLSSSTSSSTSRSSLSSSSPRKNGGVSKLMHNLRLKKHIPSEPNAVNHIPSHHRIGSNNNPSDGDIALPFLPPFPVGSKLLVHLEKGTGEAKDDAKIAARTSALFEYYTQLFNSEEGELFLEIVQLQSIEQAEQQNISNNSNNESQLQDVSQSSSSRGGGLFKFLARHSLVKSFNSSADVTKRLEFSAPVQVSSSGKARPLKHAKSSRSSELSALRSH
ncbi:hypothetical protein Gpo141_00011796 [Globisporangium polare]